ncbi:hypothetical protein A3731_05885 [Roseovarius sp. HI0049]|nr:hypothetical protein A3731_05885 [Roseovarius sp. HI0049]
MMLPYSHCLRTAIITLLVMLTTASNTQARNENCLPHLKLLNTPLEELSNVSSCDLIGAAFLWGWGEGIDYKEKLPINDNYQYYYLIRTFLNKPGQGEDLNVNDTGILLAALSMLPSLEGKERQRAAYYRAFILRQFLNSNKAIMGDEKYVLDDLIVFFLRDGTFERFSEFECFIQSDIPTVPASDVLSSQLYHDCLEVKNR